MLAGERGQLDHHLGDLVGRAEQADAVADLVQRRLPLPGAASEIAYSRTS
jgi:hypothetical protein